MALVLVDVDGTLIEGLHSERLFFRYLLAQRVLGLRQLIAFGAFPPRYMIHFGHQVFKKNKAYLHGLSVTAIEKAAAEFVDTLLLQRVSASLRQRLEYHAQIGDILALLTGTPEFIARPLAAYLAIPHVIATVCEQRDGCFTARPPYQHPFGAAKVAAAEELCHRLAVPLSACIAYADSIHDLPLMERVRRAVAVAPDSALRAQASRQGWEIIPA